MDTVQADKKELSAKVERLVKREDIGKASPEGMRQLKELLTTMQNDTYTVVVVGEFKRGKSTFINALLGTSLLPMDVLPETTTLNAVHYSEKPQVTVVKMDGSREKGEATYAYLSQFSARNPDFDATQIKYLDIGYPLPLLKPRVVFVDTPGVSDLNEQRCDITFQFLPRANAVLFLLDATSPLKKTEKDFIDKRILPLGIKNLIFLANKYDNIDEEEDEDVLDDLQERLEKAFKIGTPEAGLDKIELYPLSGKWALAGEEKKDEALYNASGLPAVQKRLQELLFSGSREKDKVRLYHYRFCQILFRILRDIDDLRQMKLATVSELEQAMANLEKLQAEREANKASIASYTKNMQENLYAMSDKSLHHFQKKLLSETEDLVMAYRGIDFKNFIERTIYKRIQRSLEGWVGIYSPHIDQLVKRLEAEIFQGLSYYFKQRIQFLNEAGHELKAKPILLHLEAADISNVNLQAGAIAALGGISIMTLVGGTIMPLISFAALPFLRDKMLNSRLESAKQQIMPQIQAQIVGGIVQLQKEIHRYIEENCLRISQKSEYAYETLLQQLCDNLQAELKEKKTADNQTKEEAKQLAMLHDDIQLILKSRKE